MLGYVDVDGMLEGIPSTMLTEWMAYYCIEPFGEYRADYRAGLISSVIAEVNRNPKKQKRPFRVRDFIPRFGIEKGGPKEKQTVEQQKSILYAIASAFGGKKKERL